MNEYGHKSENSPLSLGMCVIMRLLLLKQLSCCRGYFLMDFLSCLLMIDCKFFFLRIFSSLFHFHWTGREKRRVETWPESATKRECSFFILFSYSFSLIPAHFFSLLLVCGDGDGSLLCSNELGSWLKSKLFWEEEEEKWPFHRT